MSGSVLIVQDDFWGNRNILARITRGGIFAESFACTGERLTVGAQAESDCEIMRLKVEYVLKSCPKSSSAHSALVGNLIHELARKNLIIPGRFDPEVKRRFRHRGCKDRGEHRLRRCKFFAVQTAVFDDVRFIAPGRDASRLHRKAHRRAVIGAVQEKVFHEAGVACGKAAS